MAGPEIVGGTAASTFTCLKYLLPSTDVSSRYIWWKLHNGDWAEHSVGNVVADTSHECPAK